MKEQMTYVAIDADDVGESVGSAVLSDDADRLSSISGKINAGVQIFSRWAEYNGGSIISSGSDEAIFQVPLASVESLEELKHKYQKETGFSVSIGLGEKISDAAKALIYAKVNGKNQIVDYSPEIEETMKQSIKGDLDNPDSDPKNKLKGGIGDSTEEKDLPQDELEEGEEVEKEHTSDKGVAKEIATDHLTEDPEYYSKLKEVEAKDSFDEDSGDEKEDKDSSEIETQQDSENEEENKVEDEEKEEDQAQLQQSKDKDEESKEEKIKNDDEIKKLSREDLDQDGQSDEEEAHGKLSEKDDLDQDGDIEHEEAMTADSEEKEKYTDENDTEDELNEDEEELSDAIAAEMEAESEQEPETESEPEAEVSVEEENPAQKEDGSEQEENPEQLQDETLKQAIFESLQIFKQNKDLLNALSAENPDLYNALIVSLQAMIEMAKELGYGGYNESTDLSSEEELNPEDFLVEEEAQEEPETEEESAPKDKEEPEEKEKPEEESESKKDKEIKKSENLQKIITNMNRAIQLLKKKEKSKEEIKKDIIKKIREKLKHKFKAKKDLPTKKPSKDKTKNLANLQQTKKPKQKETNSFCATSHQKMRTSGKDCRSNEDKDSPLCVARQKNNCRGKNEEKGPVIQKSEKLKQFLTKKGKK